jgi:hypothetical protein
MTDVLSISSDEIVDGDDAMTFCQKPIYEMRTEKTRPSGDDRNGLGIFGHSKVLLIAAAHLYQREVLRIVTSLHGYIVNRKSPNRESAYGCSVRCPQPITRRQMR